MLHSNSGWNNTSVLLECNVVNSTIVNNVGGAYYNGGAHNCDVENSIIWGNSGVQCSSCYSVEYSIIDGGHIGTGNISSAPQLTGSYTLGSSSPAIDAGNPDLDGDGNDYLTDSDDQDPDGTRLDIGAYYYQQGPIVNYNSSNSQNYNAILWAPNGETTSSIKVQPSTTTTYSVDVTSGTTTCQSDVTITVQPLPTVDLGTDVVLCNGATQTLDSGSHTSYLWSTGATTQTIDVNTAGTYFVTVQDATGCEASDTLLVETLSVDISQIDTTICEGDNIDMEVDISKGTPPSIAGLTYYGTYNYNYYYTSNIDADAPTAISNCSAAGGHLVSINDAEENIYVSSILPGHFWIGYTDELVEGTFVWVDGSTSTYTNWANNEPNNSGPTNNEDYTLINATGTGDGFWNDGDNTSSFPYVCEFNNNYTIAWSPSGETTSSITAKPTSTTTYTVDVTSGTNTCQSDVTITVQPLPTVDLGIDVAICQGDSTLLDAGSGHTNYLWNTGDTTQTIYADTAGTYSVTVGNGVPTTNSSLSFDGNDDFIEINDASSLQVDEFSASINVYIENIGADMALFNKLEDNADNEQFYCGINSSGQLHFGIKIGSNCVAGAGWQLFTSTVSLNPNQWYYLTYIYDTDKLKLYIDGVLVGEDDILNDGPIDDCIGGPIRIGKHWNGDPNFYEGKIDNIEFWNTALTQSEIQSYMSSPPTGNEAGLVGYWNFNEGTGTTLTDLSGNGNNGTINGATWSTDAPAQYANNCTATDDVVVSVNPQPIVDSGIDQTICDGSSATLTASIGNNYTIDVTASGASDYTLSGAFSGNDPPINITLGDTLTFNVNSSGHPFYLKTSNTTGTSDAISVANNGTSSGTISWSPTTAGTTTTYANTTPNGGYDNSY